MYPNWLGQPDVPYQSGQLGVREQSEQLGMHLHTITCFTKKKYIIYYVYYMKCEKCGNYTKKVGKVWQNVQMYQLQAKFVEKNSPISVLKNQGIFSSTTTPKCDGVKRSSGRKPPCPEFCRKTLDALKVSVICHATCGTDWSFVVLLIFWSSLCVSTYYE